MNRAIAEELANRFRAASALANRSLIQVKVDASLGQVKRYGKMVGEFMGACCANLLLPIWKQFPELEPADMKSPYVPEAPTLSPESQTAIREFLHAFKEAIGFSREALTEDEARDGFPFGGVPEIELAAAKIADFLTDPQHTDSKPY